jgi:hypothetical protein
VLSHTAEAVGAIEASVPAQALTAAPHIRRAPDWRSDFETLDQARHEIDAYIGRYHHRAPSGSTTGVHRDLPDLGPM